MYYTIIYYFVLLYTSIYYCILLYTITSNITYIEVLPHGLHSLVGEEDTRYNVI